jgi:DNA repair photolyase
MIQPMQQSNPIKKIIYSNMPTHLGLDWSINPYLHPQNTFSNYNVWQNFNQMLDNASINLKAPEQVAQLFEKQNWNQKIVSLSGNIDCYNKLEGKLKLTRGVLKQCIIHSNPLSIITRNDLILRDIDLLKQLQKNNLLKVFVQINTTKDYIRAKLEPTSSHYHTRVALVKTLIDNGIETGVIIAPIIKNLSESCIAKIMVDANYVGAKNIYTSQLKVREKDLIQFNAWMQVHFPELTNIYL